MGDHILRDKDHNRIIQEVALVEEVVDEVQLALLRTRRGSSTQLS